jgi:hypothetical protein
MMANRAIELAIQAFMRGGENDEMASWSKPRNRFGQLAPFVGNVLQHVQVENRLELRTTFDPCDRTFDDLAVKVPHLAIDHCSQPPGERGIWFDADPSTLT